MGLYLGENEPTNIYLGDVELTAIYLGETEIWSNSRVKILSGVFCPGLCYINTGFTHDYNYKLEVDCAIEASAIFGNRPNVGYRVRINASSGSNGYKYRAQLPEIDEDSTIDHGTRCIVTIDQVAKQITIAPKDGSTPFVYTLSSGSFEPVNSTQKFLFGADDDTYDRITPYEYGIGTIYGAKLWFNDVLAAEFVPAMYKGTISGEKNPIGLYNTVTDTFYRPIQRFDQTSNPATNAPFVDSRLRPNIKLLPYGGYIPGWSFTNPKNLDGETFDPATDDFIANDGYYGTESAFYASVATGNKSDQMRIVNGKLQIEGYANIKRGIYNYAWRSEWSMELVFEDFDNSTYAPITGTSAGRMINFPNLSAYVYFNFGDNRLVVNPFNDRDSSYVTIYGNYGASISDGKVYCNDITLSIMQDGFHSIKIGKKKNDIYFFFDDIIVCKASVHSGVTAETYLGIGGFGSGDSHTPKFTIGRLLIHDNWQYESLLNNPT